MNSKGSKAKGSAFERKIEKDLRQEFGDLAEFPVRRTTGSGSSEDDADIACVGRNLIEVKHWKRFPEVVIERIWKRVVEQARKKKMRPVFIFKENYRGIKVVTLLGDWKVVMDYEDWKKLAKKRYGWK